MTQKEFFEDQKRQGYTKEQALTNYKAYSNMGLSFEQPTQNMYSPLSSNPYIGLPEKNKEDLINLNTKEDQALERLRGYYSAMTGVEKSADMAMEIAKRKYPEAQSMQDILNQELVVADGKLAKEYLREPKRDIARIIKDFGRMTAGKVTSTFGDVAIGLAIAGENVALNKIANPFQSREEIEASIEKTKPTRELIVNKIKEKEEGFQDYLTGDIPDYVKNSPIGTASTIAGELAILPLYAVPGIGAALGGTTTLSRYYASSYEEYVDAGYIDQDAHNRALGFTAKFGSLGVALDLVTAGVGGRVAKAIARSNGKRSATKLISTTSAMQGSSEFLSETLESAQLQYDTTGEINWNQATKEGQIAAITAIIGVGGFGAFGAKQRSDAIKKMKDEGYTEQEITELNNAFVLDDKDSILKIVTQKEERQAATRGERLDQIANPHKYAADPNPDQRMLSIGDFREIASTWRQARDDKGNPYKTLDDFVADNFIPEVQEAAKLAIQMPEARTRDAYNDLASQALEQQSELNEELNDDVDIVDTDDPVVEVQKLDNEIKMLSDMIKNPKPQDDVATMRYTLNQLIGERDLIMQTNPDKFYTPAPVEDIDLEVETEPVVEFKDVDVQIEVEENLSPVTLEQKLPLDVSQETLNYVNGLSDVEYIDYMAHLLATKQNIPEIIQDQLADRFGRSFAEAAGQIKRKAAKLSKQYQTAEPEGANPDADNRSAFYIMEASFSKLEQDLINKPKSYWLQRADIYINTAIETARNNGNPLPNYNREVVANQLQFEDTRVRAKDLRMKVSDAVQSGKVNLVKQILREEGIKLDRAFGKGLIKATEKFAYEKKVVENNTYYPPISYEPKVDDLDNFIDSVITQQYEDAAEYAQSIADSEQIDSMIEIVTTGDFELLARYIEEEIYGDLPQSNAEVDALVDTAIRAKYQGMSRRELQMEAQFYGVKANDKSVTIIENIIAKRKEQQIAEETPDPQEVIKAVAEEQTDLISDLNNAVEEQVSIWVGQLGLMDLNLTPEEAQTAMQYFAYKQGYDPLVQPIEIGMLHPDIQAMLEGETGWNTISAKIADQLADLKEELNIKFSAIQGFYFPMRHAFGEAAGNATVMDLTLESFGRIASQRRGNFDGVIKDPIKQLMGDETGNGYLQDAARIVALGNLIKSRKETLLADPAETARRLEEYNNLSPEERGETEKPAVVVAKEELQQLEREGEKLGIQITGATDVLFYDLVSQHEANELKQDIFNANLEDRIPDIFKPVVEPILNKIGQGWANSIDPAIMVPWMDGADTRQIKDGQIYGANTKLLHLILRNSAGMADSNYALKQEQGDLLKPVRHNVSRMQEMDVLLSKHLLDDKKSKMFLFSNRKPDAKAIEEKLKVTKFESQVIEWHRDKIVEIKAHIALGNDLRSDLSILERNRRQDFYYLEQRIKEGTATEDEVNQYKAFDPKVDLTPENKRSVQEFTRRKLRTLARWAFEETAIDERNFFAYFESASNIADKGDYFHETSTLIENWANYLDSIGQTKNAQYWRDRLNYSIKGDLFKWEDTLIDWMAAISKKTQTYLTGSDLDKGLLDGMKAKSNKDIKSDFVKIMAKWQQFMITKNLAANIGWLPTQMSSYALVAPAVINEKGALQALKDSVAGVMGKFNLTEEQVKELSAVSGIKGARKKDILQMFSFEDSGIYADSAVKRTKRRKFREVAGGFASLVESNLTQASFLAGKSAGINLGLNEDQAIIHGDLIAAQTQTMYDQINRNMALNSKLLKTWRPFMSFTYSAWSQANRMAGVTGVQMSRKAKAKAVAVYTASSKLLWLTLSLMFGDDLLKAIFNPTYNKFTPGSFIPLFGKDIDIAISKFIPWMDDESWKKDGMLVQMSKRFGRVLEGYIEGKPNANRNAGYFLTSYVVPGIGIPGSVLMNNFMRMYFSSQDNYEFLDVNGKKYAEFEDPSAIRWVGGTVFGTKAVDKPESLIKIEE